MRKRITIVAIAGMTAVANAGPHSKEQAFAEMADRSAKCTSYFTLMKRCMGPRFDEQQQKSLDEILNASTKLQDAAGRGAGRSEKAMRATFEIHMNSMKNEINANCKNFEILLNSYDKSCSEFLIDARRNLEKITRDR